MTTSKNRTILDAVQDTRAELIPFLRRLDFRKISRNNAGYLAYESAPVEDFIDGELARYLFTIDHICGSVPAGATILDVGFFVPFLPICLSKLGYRVLSVERLSAYEGALDALVSLARSRYQIEVLDCDLSSRIRPELPRCAIILLLAVLEHLNGSPKALLENLHSAMDLESRLIVEVPNAASLGRRLKMFFKGQPPYAPIEDYFASEYPFAGHNREYTVREIKYVLAHTGFAVLSVVTMNHSLKSKSWREKILELAEKKGPSSFRPSIWVNAQRKD